MLVNTNQQIEATIGEIRRGQADKEVNKAAREKLEYMLRAGKIKEEDLLARKKRTRR